MKKFFTIAAGMLIAVGGFSANAADPAPTFSGPTAQGVITATYAPLTGDEIIGSTGEADDALIYCSLQSEGLPDIKIPFNGTGGYPDWTPPATNRITVGDKSLTFELQDVITFNGHYTLVIPSGFTQWMNDDYDWNTINVQYTYEFDWTLGQENTGTEYIPSYDVNDNTVDINWSNVTSLAAGTTTGATVTNTASEVVTTLYYDENYSSPHIRIYDGNTLRVNMGTGEKQLPAGEYKLYVPAGFVKFNGGSETNAAIDYTFNLVMFEQGTVNYYGPTDIPGNPGNSYSSTKGTITLEFENIKDIKAASVLSGITVNGVEVDPSNITVPGLPANIININVAGNTGLKNGDNTLVVGEGNFTLTDKNAKQGPNTDLEYKFTYSGVGQKDPMVTINFTLETATEFVDDIDDSELPSAVTISYTALKDGTYQSIQVPVESTLVTAELPYAVNVDIAPVGKYMITNVSNPSGDLTIESTTDEEGNTSGGVEDYDSVWSFSIPESPSFESTFVNVQVGLTPASVYLSFECNDTDVTTSAQDLVTINYGTSTKQVATDNGYRVYLANSGSTVTVAPVDNYAILGVAITNADQESVTLEDLGNYGSSYSVADGIYTFNFGYASSGLNLLFDVEPTTKTGTDITINYTGEDLMASAWTYVTTKTMMSEIDVDSDEFVYTYTTPDEALDLYFIPDDSDFKVEVTCVKSSNNQAYGTVSAASNMGTNAIQLSIPTDEATGVIPTDLVITVTVKQYISSVNVNFHLSGVDNPETALSVTYGDSTLEFDSSFVGTSATPGTVFTLTPVSGYKITEISTFTDGVGTINKPALENGAWTVAILDEPADSFVTFSVTLAEDKSSAVNSISKDAEGAVIYNLNGVRVNNASKGIFIINGKKAVVK